MSANRDAPLRKQNLRRRALHAYSLGGQRVLRAQAMLQHESRMEGTARVGAGAGGFGGPSARRLSDVIEALCGPVGERFQCGVGRTRSAKASAG